MPVSVTSRATATRQLRVLAIVALVALRAVSAAATPFTINPYLGITITKDSLVLGAPADQTPGTGLGVHTANVNVVTIDLTAPGIAFKVSPDNGAAAGEVRTQTTLAYLSQENAQLAVNAHFFNFTTNAAVNTTVTGFAASNGTVFSAFEPAALATALLPYALTADSPGINISATNVAQIVNVGPTQTSLAVGVVPYNTVSGSDQVITNGAKTLPAVVSTVTGPHQVVTKSVPPFGAPALGDWYTDQIAARTALGLSADNTTMFIFTVDAAGGSNGMTVSEEVDYLLAHYAIYNLINLDGGGSTTLAMEDPVTHVDRIFNTVGAPRFVGTSLAIFADPVPVPEPSPLVLVLSALGLVLLPMARRVRGR